MSNNPLRQYFRRPVIYIKLPSRGRFYSDETITIPENEELPIYPMSAIDEITSRTPDALFNGQAVVDIIKSCVPCIHNPWNVSLMDLESLLIAIKIATSGEYMDINSTCPKCTHEATHSLNLVQVLGEHTKPITNFDYQINDLNITLRYLTYNESNKLNLEQYELQKVLKIYESYEDTEEKMKQTEEIFKKLSVINKKVMLASIESIQTPETLVTESEYISEFLDNCDRNTYNIIKDQIIKIKNDSQLQPLNLKCTNCEHEYQQSLVLNVSDFFV